MVDVKELIRNLCRCIIYTATLFIFLLLFYGVSYWITSFGSILLFILLAYGSLRIFVYFSIFPGSFPLWSRSILTKYSKTTNLALRNQANEFCSAIKNLKSSSKPSLSLDLISFIQSLNSTSENLQTLKISNSLAPNQEELLNILQKILSSFSQIQLIHSKQTYSLQEWFNNKPCDHKKCEFDKDSLVIDPAFTELDRILKEKTQIFASLDYMRADLINKFNCKRTQLEMSDKVKIDCLWIPSENSQIAVILCSSNGGLYEFSCFQSDWVKFYKDLGYNIFMWNYRGYGKSKGWPSISRLKKDGENIVNFIRTDKLHIKVLGIHGESLGGCIAIHLAKECLLDFLVADRTFTCLRSVALFGYGRIGYWVSRVLQIDSSEYIGEYLSANCKKVILSDPNDKIITDLASIKTGVAVRLLSHDVVSVIELSYLNPQLQARFNHIITYAAATSCIRSLLRLQEFLQYFKNSEKQPNKKKFKYLPINIDTEDISTDELAGDIDRMLVSISNIEAGGKNILEVVNLNDPGLGLIIWLMVLDIWGSCSKMENKKVTNHIRSVNEIRNCLQEIQNILEEYEKSEILIVQEVFKDVNTVFNVLIEVLGYMEERCGLSSNLEITIDRMITEYACAGELIPVTCGHLGSLSQPEKYQLSKYLLFNIKS